MQIRRPLAALLAALALAVGGALTSCESPGRTGTPADNAKNTSGGDPGGVLQGNLPFTSNHVTGSNSDSGRAGGDQQGNP